MTDETDQFTDERLVQKAKSGDDLAFGALFDRHYETVYAYVYRMCLNAHDAEDITQEAFVRAAKSLSSMRGLFFKAWIYRIATNLARDAFRKKIRQSSVDDYDLDSLPAQTLAPEVSHAREVLARLSLDLRQAVALVYSDGMTHAEAARVLGCAEATVSWRIFIARKKLRKLLAKEEAR